MGVLSDSSMATELGSGGAVIQTQVQPGSKAHAFDAPPLYHGKVSGMLWVLWKGQGGHGGCPGVELRFLAEVEDGEVEKTWLGS